MQGTLDIGQFKIINVNPTPFYGDVVVPKSWVENNFLQLNDDMPLTGPLNMDGNWISLLHEPTKRHHAATKSDVDNQIISSKTDILQQADVTISEAFRNHADILDRQIRKKV